MSEAEQGDAMHLQRSSATASARTEQIKAENVNEQAAQKQRDLEPARINQFDLLI